MVIKRIRNYIDIQLEYLKLILRNRRKGLLCPMCNKSLSKIDTLVFCKKCDEKFSNYPVDKKKTIIENIKHRPNKSNCFLCNQRGLKLDNKLFYCINCDMSFHQ